jgi:trk system potassium uptake protein TrkH
MPLGTGSFWQRVRPEQLFVGSFLLIIVLGTLGLKLIPGMFKTDPMNWLDAIFTITSAVCVTGLVVENTAQTFTIRGQAWILLCMQLGGLGVIVLSSFIILALGGRMGVRSEMLVSSATDVAPKIKPKKFVRDVVIFALTIEAIGAILLYILWRPWQANHGMPHGESIWHAVFQSVSAFCNAGFSSYTNGLIDYRHSGASLLVLAGLIILGGFGFLSMEELYRRIRNPSVVRRLSLNTKLSITMLLILVLGGWLLLGIFEWSNPATLHDPTMTTWDRLVNALFMSVSARTAGFNTFDFEHVRATTSFMTIILMTIGGAPGSTAGGLKTTTIAIVLLLALSRLRRQSQPTIWGRTIPEETTQRAMGLVVFSFVLTILAVMLLLSFEPAMESRDSTRLLPLLFETVSAFNTVGLSLNVTTELSDSARGLMILLMFIGRVGPLTVAASIALANHSTKRFRYAHEDVVVG